MRVLIEDAIESLILLLDEIDGDTDQENDGNDDREWDAAEHGIADRDGFAEQWGRPVDGYTME